MVEKRHSRLDAVRHAIAVFPMQQHRQVRRLGQHDAEVAEIADRWPADAFASRLERAAAEMRAQRVAVEPIMLHQRLPFTPQPAGQPRRQQRQKKRAHLFGKRNIVPRPALQHRVKQGDKLALSDKIGKIIRKQP